MIDIKFQQKDNVLKSTTLHQQLLKAANLPRNLRERSRFPGVTVQPSSTSRHDCSNLAGAIWLLQNVTKTLREHNCPKQLQPDSRIRNPSVM